jgi:Rad51
VLQVGGHVIAHASTVRLSLRKGKAEQRIMKVLVIADITVCPGWSFSCLQGCVYGACTAVVSSGWPALGQVADAPNLAEGDASYAISDEGTLAFLFQHEGAVCWQQYRRFTSPHPAYCWFDDMMT